jgi:hypothetical protein
VIDCPTVNERSDIYSPVGPDFGGYIKSSATATEKYRKAKSEVKAISSILAL